MAESAQARGEAEGRPAPAPDFRSALGGGADGTVSDGSAGSAARVAPAPPSGAVEGAGAAEAVPGPRITGALHEPAAPQAPEVALDRPGKPVLAGAAIAGLLLVAAPFAMTAGVPGVTLDTTPLASGAGGADGTGGQTSGTAESGASAGGESGAVAAPADTGAAPAAQQGGAPQETGYVPEVAGDGASAPTMPDPGNAAAGGGNPVQTAPAAQEVPDTAAAGAPESGGGAGEATAAGEPGAESAGEPDAGNAAGEPGTEGAAAGDGDTAAGPSNGEEGADQTAGEDTAAAGDEGAGTSGEGETEGAAAGESAGNGDTGTGTGDTGTVPEEMNAPLADTTGTGDTARESGAAGNGDTAGGGSAPADAPASEGGGSVLADSGALTAASDPEPFLAVAGPGCQASPGASYTNEGRWDSAEGTASWATRPGGYAQEGCDGGYEALPVSGDPEQGNGQYATWTFTPGEAGVACELYVHVPDDESPLWISPGEAKYQLFSGPAAEGSPVAVFGIDQAGIRGGWVQVTGFTSPTEEFTVQLTNAGTDALADQEHASSHVAASAVRASCS
ncbi:hypothetical protein [Nocardiopsis dassonvillei]|uniref:hypothetical protein n=1 Tax=Nocardiopsis dassonvillei TaxID=2014 RepID=UPI000B9D7104|nr:hypothetical protein [Nocardiopsis dassonvillei]ASU57810.1 hypothetical protein CGQ36_09750 [Nocardiopsis dassonvillei]